MCHVELYVKGSELEGLTRGRCDTMFRISVSSRSGYLIIWFKGVAGVFVGTHSQGCLNFFCVNNVNKY